MGGRGSVAASCAECVGTFCPAQYWRGTLTKLRLKPTRKERRTRESSLIGGRGAAATKTASKAKTCLIRTDLGFRRCLAGSRHDLAEAPNLEAGTADERAVDVRLGDQLGDIVSLHASPVDHVTTFGGIPTEPLAQACSDVGMRFPGLSRRGNAPCADGPDGLVRHYEFGHLLGREAIETVLDLAVEDG